MKNNKVFITFNYELSLGLDSGTALKNLIEPTEIILNQLEEYSANALFFIDSAYLLKLAERNHSDLNDIKEQLQKIANSGHDIGLLIHPQWQDAMISKTGHWSFKSNDKNRLHDLSDHEIDLLFYKGIRIIKEIVRPAKQKLEIQAFRAGNWSIQPFSRLQKYFIKNNLVYDFSVAPGLFSDNFSCGCYHFFNAPKNLALYNFNDDPCIAVNRARFIEIPLTTFEVFIRDLWLNHYWFQRHEKIFGDGTPACKQKKYKIRHALRRTYKELSIDNFYHKYFIKFMNQIQKRNLNFITIVGYPKRMSNGGIKNLQYLLKNFQTMKLDNLSDELI
jgi:hypothetical protein